MTKPHEETWTWNETTGNVEVHWTKPGPHYGVVGHADVESFGRLMAAAPATARLLLELEWSGVRQYSAECAEYKACPVCKNVEPSAWDRGAEDDEDVRTYGEDERGHAPDCRLVAVLRAAGVFE